MASINVAVIGTGWIGEIRALACAAHPLVEGLYLAEIDEAKGRRVAQETNARQWTMDYKELLRRDDIQAIIVSTTPEDTHYPIARECLLAGKHVLLEKPMALALEEADELIGLARRSSLKLTIGYTQRFNPKYAYVKKALADGTLGRPVTALVSRSVSRGIGSILRERSKLGPAQMEATHDIDFVLWCLEHSRPRRVYAQSVYRVLTDQREVPDCTWIMVTMEDGVTFTIGANWVLPPGYPKYSSASIEFIGSESAVFIDDTHRDILLHTGEKGALFPLSTMPGEPVLHVYQGPMMAETNHFIECVALDRPPLVTAEQARQVMEVTLAADLSAERGEPVNLPL